MTDLQFVTVPIGNARLHVLPTDKFKTTAFAVLLEQELTEEKVTKTALLPNVLQRGTQSFPTTIAFQRRQQELYGANVYGDVFKRGERHIVNFGIDVANGEYLQGQPALLEEGLSFLAEVLFAPVTENGGFSASFVQAEKKNLKQKIESLQDDKIRYAAQRLNEVMCEGEPYALHNYGRISDLTKIDAHNLYTYYQEMIQTCPMDLYCVGDVNPSDVSRLVEKYFAPHLGEQTRQAVVSRKYEKQVQEVRLVVDELDVKQGKLNIGFRTHVTVDDELYPALLLYNGVLGGFAHSKLFMNVREKESLAYYCSSRAEGHLGLMSIQSGIEIANYDKALTIIKEQLQTMVAGEITEQEIEKTKATLTNQLRERLDSAYGLIDLAHNATFSKRNLSLDQLLTEIAQVDLPQIQQVAERVEMDTIYFLRDQGGAPDANN